MGGSPVVCGDSIQPLCQPAPSVAMGNKGGPDAACAASASVNPTSRAYHVCGLMHTRNKDRFMWTTGSARRVLGRWATTAAAAVCGVTVFAAAEQGSQPSGGAPAAAGGLVLTSPMEPPTPRATLAAYNAVETWVRAWATPAADAALPADLPACYGACVHLRLNGQPVGRGVAMVTSAADAASAALIVEAAEEAIRTANARLPVSNDLTRGDAIKLLTPDIQISLELAGAPIPIVDDSWGLVDTALAPGLDGLLVRREGVADGEGVVTEFPSQMMLTGGLPQKSIRAMIAHVIGEGGAAEVLLMPREIRDKHAVKMYRFRVSHVAQCGPRRGAEFLYRGARLATMSMERAELEAMATSMAGFLEGRIEAAAAMQTRQSGEDAANRRRADASLVNSMLLAGMALNAYWDGGRSAPDRVERQATTKKLLQVLGEHPRGLIQRAMYLNAFPAGVSVDDVGVAQSIVVIQGAYFASPTGSPQWAAPLLTEEITDAKKTPLDVVERLVILANYARYRSRSGPLPKAELDEMIAAVRRMFVDTPSERLVSLMPWLGWAEVDLVGMTFPEPGQRADIPSALALRAMRDEVWKHQLTALDATDDSADMIGGIVFTSGNTSPLPTWQCVRPLAFMATMLGDDRLTEPQERALELARLLQAMRFLRQLQVDESCGWMYANPEAAIGGIRGAVWDHTLNPDATSMALLAVVELLKSMDRIAPEMLKDEAAPGVADPANSASGKP